MNLLKQNMQQDVKNNLETLLAVDVDFSLLSEKIGPASAFKEYLSKDSIMLPNNQNPIVGIVNISKSMELGADEKMTWQPKGGMVDSIGEMGYTWGEYTLVLENKKEIKGKYLNVWNKIDNKWKVIADIGNNSPI